MKSIYSILIIYLSCTLYGGLLSGQSVDNVSGLIDFDDKNYSFVGSSSGKYSGLSESSCQVFILDFLLNDSTVLLRAIPAVGVPPYEFNWSNGQTNTQIEIELNSTELYCVSMTDTDQCVSVDCYQGNQNAPCDVEIFQFNSSSGFLLIASARGTNPLNYEWSTGESTMSVLATQAGDYCITITDSGGCTATTCITIEEDWIGECDFGLSLIFNSDMSAATLDIENFNAVNFDYFTLNDEQVIFPVEIEYQGDYTVKATRTENYCQVTKSIFVDFSRNCNASPIIQVSPNLGFNVLTAQLQGGSEDVDYLWTNYFWEEPSIVANMSTIYCVQIFDNAEGCLYKACQVNSILGAQLYGNIKDPLDGATLSGKLYLYQLQPDGPFLSDSLEAIGFFNTYISRDFDHLVKVQPNSRNGRSFAPSYYRSSLTWEEAIPIESTQIQLNGISPIAVEIHETEGEGLISGQIGSASENINIELYRDVNDIRSQGWSGLDVVLISLDEDAVVGHAKTSTNGEFLFDNLKLGHYRVLLSVPGISSTHRDVLLDAENPHNGAVDLVLQHQEAAWLESELVLYPVPTDHELFIENKSQTEYIERVMIYNIQGQVISLFDQGLIPQSKIMINTSDWVPGAYIIQAFSHSGSRSFRVLKQ